MAVDFLSMSSEERANFIKALCQPQFRVKQIEEWLFSRAVLDYNQMTNLPLSLREQLVETKIPLVASSLRDQQSSPSAVKFVVELADLQLVEAVIMFYHHGVTLCVSSQVGCKMACGFCASGQGGYKRNLSSHEMTAQLILANNLLSERDQKVTHIVMMGMGEPLDNYEATIGFLRTVASPHFGISPRRITVSTCGLVPQIERLALEGLPVTLSVSLHAPNDTIREQLMPVSKRYAFNQVLAAMHLYQQRSGRRVTIEYTLIKGVNDSEKNATELATKIRGGDFHVNLIPVNPVEGMPWERPTLPRVRRFQAVLVAAGINATIRREIGVGISGSCGQLRRSLTDKR
ncbi:MAG: 23S rRNA (adenine2503-C2)-methyltransferase [Bacillota bacterium]|nr:MAG: 23S rRNA (adenine2503-C2)-methyltransferase [Bacillota bacterium]MBS3951003.1 23S rRNA (adenine(2503)-C(2))-methyltransferase RlmN [Peptococcaceae bacterium]